MHHPALCVRFTLLLALVLTAAVAAQEEPQSAFGEELEVTEVLLDVLVTDSSGNVVLGLGPDDFVVEEAGEAMELRSVSFYSNRRLLGPTTVTGVQPDPEPAPRYFILFFHDQRQDLAELARQQLDAGRYVKRWIADELLSNDYTAVVSYDVKLKVHHDFTNDREALAKAVDKAIVSAEPPGNWPSRQPETTGPSLLRNLPQGVELRKQTPRVQQALRLVAEASASFAGRKNMLLFSIGFGDVDNFNTYSPDPRYDPPMMAAFNDANVAVYTIDWVPTTRGGGAQTRTLSDSLSHLAFETGGTYSFLFNSFATPLTRIEEENNGYYLLAYSSTYEAGTTGFRKVKVSTRNPKLRVRTRTGYQYGS